ncbi:MAG TPA: hypothetical protein PK095_00570 [Myxococcota bacterium]|nr:hypothetical protein [Myxococcota bacterium]
MGAELDPLPPSQNRPDTCSDTPTSTTGPHTDSKRAQRGQTVEAYEESVRPAAEPFVPMCPTTRARTSTPLPADKVTRALDAIDRLGHAMALHREQVSMNYLENIRRYLLATGSDGALAMSRSEFTSIASGQITSSFATVPAQLAVDHGLERLAGAAAKGLGILGGVVLGILYETLKELIFDPTGKALRAAFNAGHAAGVEKMAATSRETVRARLSAFTKDALLLSELRGAVTFASSAEALDGLCQWVDKEIPPLCLPVVELSLYQRMLETWVLQRAGDEEDANKHTDGAVYDKAHKHLAPSGNLARRDLFIHQTRFELGRLGIDAEPTLALWQTLVDVQPDADPARTLAALGPLRIDTTRFANPDRFIRTIRETDGRFALAPTHLNHVMDSDEVAETERNGIPRMHGLVGGNISAMLKGDLKNAQALQHTLRTGGLRLSIELDLTDADGAIFVDHFRYRIVGLRHREDGAPESPQDLPIRSTEWTDSPD